jgi:tRNA-dihydrouridine synthase B
MILGPQEEMEGSKEKSGRQPGKDFEPEEKHARVACTVRTVLCPALMSPESRLRHLLSHKPVILAPMEDVSDAVFRGLCRSRGAELCVTEFVNAEGLLRGCRNARRKIALAPQDRPTGIQIYGSDPGRLCEAAELAEAAQPTFIDINCGCWVPKIAGRGAGAAWLRDPAAMVQMAERVVEMVSLPVTVKTRIGWGPESEMPIVDLARRLEDVGVKALFLHCRVAKVGHSGPADWSWAKKAQQVVSIPVVVNGDVKSADDAQRALDETGCAGVMVGRAAIDHPWIFREARALIDTGTHLPGPMVEERIGLLREHFIANVAARGQPFGLHVTRRHVSGYLKGIAGAAAFRRELMTADDLDRCLEILDGVNLRRAA